MVPCSFMIGAEPITNGTSGARGRLAPFADWVEEEINQERRDRSSEGDADAHLKFIWCDALTELTVESQVGTDRRWSVQ